MFDREIRDSLVPAQQPDATLEERNSVDEILAFEDVHPPLSRWWRLARFWGFVVFENGGGASHGIGFFGEETGGFEIWFLFIRWWGFAGCDFAAEGVVLRGEWCTGLYWSGLGRR
jgi:hypothetical protein